MNIGWVGFHMEGMPALRSVLLQGFPIKAVLTLKPEIAARKSGAGDYASLCREFDVPIFEVASINDPVTLELLRCLNLDVVFVIGWTELLRPECLRLGRLGMVGAHASLLPRDRGRAPINWALIRGLETTGNSLIWLSEGVDQGDLIDQTIIPITPYDTCASLYEKVGRSNRDMILRLIPQLFAGARPGTPQTEVDEPPLTRRRPDDGGIDWSMSSRQVYDFVRALTRPYPGAFSWLDGHRWRVWSCGLLPNLEGKAVAGEVLGGVLSPVGAACGQVVQCGKGAVVLLEVEPEGGKVMLGQELSDQRWTGRVWSDGG